MFFKDKILLDYVLELIGDGREYLNSNGMSYGEVVTAELDIGSTVSSDLVSTQAQSAFTSLFDSESATNRLSLRVGADGVTFQVIGGTATLDGSPIVTGVTVFPTDSLLHKYVFTAAITGNVKFYGTNFTNSLMLENVFQPNFEITGITNTGVYPTGVASWPIGNGFTLAAITPNVNDPSGNTDMDLFNVLEGDWTTELPS